MIDYARSTTVKIPHYTFKMTGIQRAKHCLILTKTSSRRLIMTMTMIVSTLSLPKGWIAEQSCVNTVEKHLKVKLYTQYKIYAQLKDKHLKTKLNMPA